MWEKLSDGAVCIFLLSWCSLLLPSRKKYNIMFGASGSHDFHMSMQNELVAGFSIHTSQLKIWTFPYRETIQWQCLPPTRYVNARDFRWRPLPIIAVDGCFLMVKKLSDGTVCFFLLSWCSQKIKNPRHQNFCSTRTPQNISNSTIYVIFST